MSKYKGWENDAGVANVIEISSGNKKLLTIKNCEAWLNMATYSDWGSTITTQPFITAHLSNGDIALLFVEYIYASQPSHLTVILRKGTAKVVFNKEYFLNSVNMSRTTFSAVIQSNTVEWIDHRALNEADLSCIVLNNDILNFILK